MEIEVVNQTKTSIKFNLHGAGHTFCNNLKKELYSDKNIDVAAYKIDHPLLGTPTFILNFSSGTKVDKILQDAVKRIKKQNDDARKLVKKL